MATQMTPLNFGPVLDSALQSVKLRLLSDTFMDLSELGKLCIGLDRVLKFPVTTSLQKARAKNLLRLAQDRRNYLGRALVEVFNV